MTALGYELSLTIVQANTFERCHPVGGFKCDFELASNLSTYPTFMIPIPFGSFLIPVYFSRLSWPS